MINKGPNCNENAIELSNQIVGELQNAPKPYTYIHITYTVKC